MMPGILPSSCVSRDTPDLRMPASQSVALHRPASMRIFPPAGIDSLQTEQLSFMN